MGLLVALSEGKLTPAECKDIAMQFVNSQLVSYNLDYLFGRERIFMKMATQNVLDLMLQKKLKFINHAASMIKVHYRRNGTNKRRIELKDETRKIQRAVRAFLVISRKLRRKKAVKIIENAWIKCH